MSKPLRPEFLLWPFLVCALFFGGGCAASLSTGELRGDLLQGNLERLEKRMIETNEDRRELVTALNLARLYQMQGRWRDSIDLYGQAIAIIEDYEQRAIVNARGVLGGVGAATLARGSGGYYGKGYERTLLHTMNAINYAMLGDFSGAAVEMRRMEQRQELWLEEKERRLNELLEEQAKKKAEAAEGKGSKRPDSGYSGDNPPPGYSMGAILNDPELRAEAAAYQEVFSYALSSVFCRLVGDVDYAEVSLRRAGRLDEAAKKMFRLAWGDGAEHWRPKAPPFKRDRRELVVLLLNGVAPALKMERIRLFNPFGGYVLIDLPAYEPALTEERPRIRSGDKDFDLFALLRTQVLAYRELKDEMNYELATAISRAATRAAIVAGGQAVVAAHKQTRDMTGLVGLALSLGMEAISAVDARGVRNWETLPAVGYMGMFNLPSGFEITVSMGDKAQTVRMPEQGRGILLLVTSVGSEQMRVDHVEY